MKIRTFWRTATGLEVDFILGNAEIAIEVKISSNIKLSEIRGLITFQEEYQSKRCIVVSTAPRKRLISTTKNKGIEILPWQDFLDELWNGKLF